MTMGGHVGGQHVPREVSAGQRGRQLSAPWRQASTELSRRSVSLGGDRFVHGGGYIAESGRARFQVLGDLRQFSPAFATWSNLRTSAGMPSARAMRSFRVVSESTVSLRQAVQPRAAAVRRWRRTEVSRRAAGWRACLLDVTDQLL